MYLHSIFKAFLPRICMKYAISVARLFLLLVDELCTFYTLGTVGTLKMFIVAFIFAKYTL
jgi:hypothetical protein